jgi:hypothetical protein
MMMVMVKPVGAHKSDGNEQSDRNNKFRRTIVLRTASEQ